MRKIAASFISLLLALCLLACDASHGVISSGVVDAELEALIVTPSPTPSDDGEGAAHNFDAQAVEPTLFLTPSPAPTPNENLDEYRGFEWGSTREDIKLALGDDCEELADGTLVLDFDDAGDGSPLKAFFFFNDDGELIFGADQFVDASEEELVQSVSVKYGPKSEDSIYAASWGSKESGYVFLDSDEDTSLLIYCAPGISRTYARWAADVAEPTPNHTPTPTPTPSPTPKPTPTPTPTPTPKPVPKTTKYVLNKNTKKFHRPSCYTIKRMSNSNRIDFEGTREEVIAKGYDPCKKCYP